MHQLPIRPAAVARPSDSLLVFWRSSLGSLRLALLLALLLAAARPAAAFQATSTPPPASGPIALPPQPPALLPLPRPDLGSGVPAPGVLLGLSPAELARLQPAPPGSRLDQMAQLAASRARLGDPTLVITAGRHLIDRRFNKAVPPHLALDLGFLADWNALVDALGLAYVATGNLAYAQRVDDHLRPWAKDHPPMGSGFEVGGEPGIYHREFVGAFRAAEHCWPVLSNAARSAVVHLARTIQERTIDWWSYTPWMRGNHAAATAQTGLAAAITLIRISRSDPSLIAPATADALLHRVLVAGATLPPIALLGGPGRTTGVVGYAPQLAIGVLTELNRPTWQLRGLPPFVPTGVTLDLVDRPPLQRLTYHALTTHHLLTSWWMIVRSGVVPGGPAEEQELHAALGELLEFSRPYLEQGLPLLGSRGTPPNPVVDPRTRELIAMAAPLFPEKAWLAALPARGVPTSYAELYAEVARFR